jgi:hypothetical protein
MKLRWTDGKTYAETFTANDEQSFIDNGTLALRVFRVATGRRVHRGEVHRNEFWGVIPQLHIEVDGRKVDVFVALREEKPFALLQYVNSRFKNIAMRKRAQVLGLKLNQFGLFRSGKKLSIRSQDQVLRMLGMSAITTK